MRCVWPLNPQLLHATTPRWVGYTIKMAQKHFVREIFMRHENHLIKLYEYAKRFGTKLAQV
jgi:hypothetical protein